MALDTRARMIATAMRLFQRDGYAATGWRGLVDAAGTPWGSAHHHFPGGKEQLGVEAVALGSAGVLAALEECLARKPDVADAVQAWFAVAAENLTASQYECGCPVATVALETATTVPALGEACATAFHSWADRLTTALVEAGLPKRRAGDLACHTVAALEGALLLARSWRDIRPLQAAAQNVVTLIRMAQEAS
ncbi:MAG TPA: TetR/AcrR family transcriptional regulator [Sporichthyaceae bacterium]|nr:TetR/AcrR family transcriptional regulator [Sporichthyaceae bacterium]